MSQSDALVSLQRHAHTRGEIIVGFTREGSQWVARLQKSAEFPPPSDDGGEEKKSPPKSEDDDGDEVVPDGPPSGDDEGGDDESGSDDGAKGDSPIPGSDKQGPQGEKGEEKGELRELMSLVHQIADKMGIVPAGHGDKMGDDGPMPPMPPGPGGPDGPPAGPPGMDGPPGGPGGPAGAEHMPTKMKPGETLPHQTPIGTPAFASNRQAMGPVDPGAPATPGAMASPPCSKCGGPTVGGVCPNCTSVAGGGQSQVIDPSGVVGRKRTFEARVNQPMGEVEAYRQATAAFPAYKVHQLIPQADGTWVATFQG